MSEVTVMVPCADFAGLREYARRKFGLDLRTADHEAIAEMDATHRAAVWDRLRAKWATKHRRT